MCLGVRNAVVMLRGYVVYEGCWCSVLRSFVWWSWMMGGYSFISVTVSASIIRDCCGIYVAFAAFLSTDQGRNWLIIYIEYIYAHVKPTYLIESFNIQNKKQTFNKYIVLCKNAIFRCRIIDLIFCYRSTRSWLKEREYLGDIGIDRRVKCNYIYKKEWIRMWTGFIWLRLVSSGGLLYTRWWIF
jgi:hypothetical protein